MLSTNVQSRGRGADAPTPPAPRWSGPWYHWMFVQTTNLVPPGASPLDAAPIIGGLPVSDQYRATLDIACGPLVFEDDGSFDIELLSI